MRTAPSAEPASRSAMPMRAPTVSLTAIRASAPKTMPVTRKMPNSRTDLSAQGAWVWPASAGASSAVAATATGMAAR